MGEKRWKETEGEKTETFLKGKKVNDLERVCREKE